MTFDPPVAPATNGEPIQTPVSEGWRSVVLITWLLVFGCMTAIAVSSRTTGRSIWWLGPTVDPAPLFMVAIPVVIVLLPMWAALKRPSIVGRTGVWCSVLLGITALPDLSDRPGVAAAVLVVAGAALLSSVAVATGTRH